MLMHALPRDTAPFTSITLLSLNWETPDCAYEVSSLMLMWLCLGVLNQKCWTQQTAANNSDLLYCSCHQTLFLSVSGVL